MTGTALTDAQANLEAAKTAYRQALSARATGFEGRTLQRQDIDQLLLQVQYWQREVDRLSAAAGLTAPQRRVSTLIVRG